MSDYTLADTWLLNNRVNLMLLDQLSDEQLRWGASPRARTIADQFAHLHNVRIMWLEVQSPTAAKKLRKIEKGAATKTSLREALEASAAAMGETIAAAEAGGKLKSVKRGVASFFGYMLAHEGHHRGQIILHLKNAKMPIDPTLGYALWEWQKI
ncbi:MAG TPA: DinB family protein [Bryobacteraceae bacterium]